MTLTADLARIRARLHDDGDLWPDAELRRLYNDGYLALLAQSGAVRRFRPLDLPGRHTFGVSQDWEDAYAAKGTVRKPVHSMQAGAYQGTSFWEVEAIEGITDTTALEGHTQEWERAYRSGDSDLHYQFTFPRNHERVVRLEWQNRKLNPVGVRDLDATDARWFAMIGEPRWWTTGTGRVRSVELYEIATTYYQTYALLAFQAGIAREFSGERTWAVETPIPNANAYAYTSPADVPTFLSGLGARLTREALFPARDYATQVLRDGPVGYWRLGEASGTSATDASGNGRTGTYSGTVTLGATGGLAGDSDTAATFGGGTVTVADHASLRIGLGSKSWEFLFKNTQMDTCILFRKSDANNANGMLVRMGDDHPGEVRVLFDTSSSPKEAVVTLSAQGPWNNGVYHRAVVTLDRGSAVAALWIDGIRVASASAAALAATNLADSADLLIAPVNDPFLGELDEGAVYSSVLSPDRIRAHNDAATGYQEPVYAVHLWEVEMLDGETTFTDSTLIGTYTWEEAFGGTAFTLAVGQPRSVSSTARQYLPVTSDATLVNLLGRICDWRSSEDSVFALEVVVPDADLVDDDTPTLIPPQMVKYLRHYVLSRALGRPGEGRQPLLSEYYGRRFARGVALFKSFGDVTRADRVWQRQAMVPARQRPAYVRLPSTFPNPWAS